jgi:hypothetical protein
MEEAEEATGVMVEQATETRAVGMEAQVTEIREDTVATIADTIVEADMVAL